MIIDGVSFVLLAVVDPWPGRDTVRREARFAWYLECPEQVASEADSAAASLGPQTGSFCSLSDLSVIN